MGDTPSPETDITIDLSEPWDVPARLLEELAEFGRIAARIEGAVPDAAPSETVDLNRAS